jgi:malate dehydrogenase (oxaloacetate-decarboxylating)
VAIVRLLKALGLKDLVLCDRQGAIWAGRDNLNPEKAEVAEIFNLNKRKGSLSEVIKGADVFIGVSSPETVTSEMIKSMAPEAIVFPMANPVPEIMPQIALEAGAAVVGTGRSDFPNQINNVLAFPGIFRGVFDVRASDVNEAMIIAAAKAIAGLVSDNELSGDYILPAPFDSRVGQAVSAAVRAAAIESKVAKIR